jgi:hypothetical protein
MTCTGFKIQRKHTKADKVPVIELLQEPDMKQSHEWKYLG